MNISFTFETLAELKISKIVIKCLRSNVIAKNYFAFRERRREMDFYLAQDDIYIFAFPYYISCIHLALTEFNKRTGHQDPKQRLTKQQPAELLRVNVYIIIGEYTRTM